MPQITHFKSAQGANKVQKNHNLAVLSKGGANAVEK
jgi:hypothetical protein